MSKYTPRLRASEVTGTVLAVGRSSEASRRLVGGGIVIMGNRRSWGAGAGGGGGLGVMADERWAVCDAVGRRARWSRPRDGPFRDIED